MAKRKAATRRKIPKGSKPAFGAKAEFVRAHPDLSAKQVVEAAKATGLLMTENHVYNVRSAAKKAGSSKTGRGTPKKASAGESRATRKGEGLEAQLRSAIAELGLARARAIFAEVEQAFAG